MPHRIVTCIVTGVALSTAVVLDGQSASAQATADKSARTSSSAAATAGRSAWSVPRMPDGRPDMQGVWANNNMTPLQRPPQFAGRATMTDAELADLKQKVKALMDGGDAFFADELILAALDGRTKFSSGDTQTGNYDQSWLSERIFDNRTSLVIDPPDGRIPPLAPAAAERARARSGAAGTRPGRSRAGSLLQHALRQCGHTEHSRRLSELLRDHAGSGRGGTPHRDDSRRAHLSDRRRPARVARHRAYHGDSRAHWDGDTLVVDTTNYVDNATRVGAATTDTLHTTETFRRVAEDTIEYSITFDDPMVWSRPWTMMIPLKKTGELMFEFACHEGNYGLRAILSGARAQERGTP